MDQAAIAGEKTISNLKVQYWASFPEILLGVFFEIVDDKVLRFCILGARLGNLPHTAYEPHFIYLRQCASPRANEPPPNSLQEMIFY